MAAPATVSVFNILRDTTGTGIANARVNCTLGITTATVAATGDAIDEVQQTTTTDANGRYAFTIVPNDLLNPANTTYTIQEPHRSYQIAPLSTNGLTQQTTASNVIVNVPTALAPAVSNLTGPITITGALTVTGLITGQNGETISAGTFTIPAGGFTMAGPLTLTAAASQIIPGATSMSLRDTGNANDNLLVSNAGLVTARAGLVATTGDVVVTAGKISMAAAASQLVPGATSFSIRDTGNANDNLIVTNAGATTVRNGVTVTAGGASITGASTVTGSLVVSSNLQAANLILSAAAAQIVPGATSLALTNNAQSANNLLLTDAGLATLRNGLLMPAAAAGALAPNSAYATVPIKIDDQLLIAGAASITFVNPLPTNFRHLLIEWYARGDTAASSTAINLRFNNISTATYDFEDVFGSGAGVSAAETLGATQMHIGDIPANTATANYFGSGEAKVKHYQSTVGGKPVISIAMSPRTDATGQQVPWMIGGKWRTTGTAVTRIDLLPGAGNFVAGSLFTLWGIP